MATVGVDTLLPQLVTSATQSAALLSDSIVPIQAAHQPAQDSQVAADSIVSSEDLAVQANSSLADNPKDQIAPQHIEDSLIHPESPKNDGEMQDAKDGGENSHHQHKEQQPQEQNQEEPEEPMEAEWELADGRIILQDAAGNIVDKAVHLAKHADDGVVSHDDSEEETTKSKDASASDDAQGDDDIGHAEHRTESAAELEALADSGTAADEPTLSTEPAIEPEPVVCSISATGRKRVRPALLTATSMKPAARAAAANPKTRLRKNSTGSQKPSRVNSTPPPRNIQKLPSAPQNVVNDNEGGQGDDDEEGERDSPVDATKDLQEEDESDEDNIDDDDENDPSDEEITDTRDADADGNLADFVAPDENDSESDDHDETNSDEDDSSSDAKASGVTRRVTPVCAGETLPITATQAATTNPRRKLDSAAYRPLKSESALPARRQRKPTLIVDDHIELVRGAQRPCRAASGAGRNSSASNDDMEEEQMEAKSNGKFAKESDEDEESEEEEEEEEEEQEGDCHDDDEDDDDGNFEVDVLSQSDDDEDEAYAPPKTFDLDDDEVEEKDEHEEEADDLGVVDIPKFDLEKVKTGCVHRRAVDDDGDDPSVPTIVGAAKCNNSAMDKDVPPKVTTTNGKRKAPAASAKRPTASPSKRPRSNATAPRPTGKADKPTQD